MKLSDERRWWLERFKLGGWSIGHGMKAGIKKWRDHSAALVKMGYLEAMSDDGTGLYHRITDAGRLALAEEKR